MKINLRLNRDDYFAFQRSSRLSTDWRAAWMNTQRAITENLSDEMQMDMERIRSVLPKLREDARCKWCNGEGKTEDHIRFEDRKIICYFERKISSE